MIKIRDIANGCLRKKKEIGLSILIIGVIFMVLFINYVLALAGEPRSEWLICHVMGLC